MNESKYNLNRSPEVSSFRFIEDEMHEDNWIDTELKGTVVDKRQFFAQLEEEVVLFK